MPFVILASRAQNAVALAKRISEATPGAHLVFSERGTSGDFTIFTSPQYIRGYDLSQRPVIFSLFCGDIKATRDLEEAAIVYGRASLSAILRLDDTPAREFVAAQQLQEA